LITWKDEYNLGIEKIDEQHRYLFAIAGRVYELLRDDFSIDKYDKIVSIINELKEYTVYHFRFEEDYMRSIGYKKFLSHKVAHDDFVARINSIDLKDMDEKQDQYIMELIDFIINWITEHILKTDKQYVNA
jgi:hemerythrin